MSTCEYCTVRRTAVVWQFGIVRFLCWGCFSLRWQLLQVRRGVAV